MQCFHVRNIPSKEENHFIIVLLYGTILDL